jgi:hypothetical protein
MEMKKPKGTQAARIRQRKFDLVRRFQIPGDLLPGSLSLAYHRCGKANCHCAKGEGHPQWSLTYMADGKKQVQFIPQRLVDQVRRKVEAGREYQEAVREVFAANAKLLALARKQRLI